MSYRLGCRDMNPAQIDALLEESLQARIASEAVRFQVVQAVLPILEAWHGKKITKRLQTKLQDAVEEQLGSEYRVYLDGLGDKCMRMSHLVVWGGKLGNSNSGNFFPLLGYEEQIQCFDYQWFLEHNEWLTQLQARQARLMDAVASITEVVRTVARVQDELKNLEKTLEIAGLSEFFCIDRNAISMYGKE